MHFYLEIALKMSEKCVFSQQIVSFTNSRSLSLFQYVYPTFAPFTENSFFIYFIRS